LVRALEGHAKYDLGLSDLPIVSGNNQFFKAITENYMRCKPFLFLSISKDETRLLKQDLTGLDKIKQE
jgi:hypothetical protein